MKILKSNCSKFMFGGDIGLLIFHFLCIGFFFWVNPYFSCLLNLIFICWISPF
jgi:hypothetical protein